MYNVTLVLHNLVRWGVVLAGLWAFWHAWRGWMQRAVWTESDLRAGTVFVRVIEVQFLLGIALYAMSPIIREGFGDFGAAMGNPSVRRFLIEHPLMMLVSVALAHIGLTRLKKATSDSGRFQTATIWWGIALASVLGFIPWERPKWPF